MTLLEGARTSSTIPTRDRNVGWPLRARAAGAAVSAALLSLIAVCLPSLLVWVASPQSTVPWTTALGIGSAGWLLAHGVDVRADGAVISLVPLLLAALPVAVGVKAVRRVLAGLDDARPRRFAGRGGLRRDVADVGLSYVLTYAATGLAVGLVASGGHVRVAALEAFAGTGVVALLTVAVATGREFRGHGQSLAPELADRLQRTAPRPLRRALAPAWWGVLATVGAGVALALADAAVHLARIGRLYDALDAGVVGSAVLSVAQLLVLPNLALWAVAWLAGPGFGIAQHSSITVTHSSPGLLPLVPVLGALPDPGPMPALARLAVLVPVILGALVAWRSVRAVTRLASWQSKARVTATACLLCCLAVASLVWLSGGSLGAVQLRDIGADPLMVGLCLLGEMLAGAAAVVAVSQWRANGWRVAMRGRDPRR